MADITQFQNYDTSPFPKEERRRGALPAVVEAGVKQELLLLNSVYENVQAGVLTQDHAAEIMWMMESSKQLLTEAVDIIYAEESAVVRDILEDCVIRDLPISGEGVLPKKVLYEGGKQNSIYKDCGWSRVFAEAEDPLACRMNRRMDYLEHGLSIYTESYGEVGFEEDGSFIYLESSDPESELFLKDYLYMVTEAAAISGTIPAENGVTIMSFLEACLINEANVGAMAPIVTLDDGEILTKNPRKKDEDISPENASMTESCANTLLNAHGWYTLEAAVVYKNNITFDSVARKLYNSMSDIIKMSNPNDPNESFKNALNLRKNQYKFSFNDSSDPNVNNTISAKILQAGFKPIKDNGKVVAFRMEKPPITITVEFEGIDTGLDIGYTSSATTESSAIDDGVMSARIFSLEADNQLKDKLAAFCESTVNTADLYMDNAVEVLIEGTMQGQLERVKVNWGEDPVISAACDTLMTAMESGNNSVPEDAVDTALGVISSVVLVETACEAVLDAAELTSEMTESSKEDIDPEIKSTIELLNRLGYKTKYSSAGYRKERSKDDRDRNGVYYGKLYTTARITFDGNYKFDELPKGWYQNFNSDKTGIYVKPFTYDEKDGSPDEAFAKWKSEYVAALKTWAENLKDAKDTKIDEKDSDDRVSE